MSCVSKCEQRRRKDGEGREQGELRERATVLVHALLRLPRGSNKRGRHSDGRAWQWDGKCAGRVRRERSQPYSGNMFRNCFTSDGTREEEKGRGRRRKGEEGGKEKIKMFRRFFVREPCVALLLVPPSTRGVTFAGCDVENWIQVWGGVYRRTGGRIPGSRGDREKRESCAARKAEGGRAAKVGGGKSCRSLEEDED